MRLQRYNHISQYYTTKYRIIQWQWNYSLVRWNFSSTMKLISVTMKLFFWEKFHFDFDVAKTCRFESLNFHFYMFNFDTMKRISFAKARKSLAPSHFWKKKRNERIVSILSFQYGAGGGTWTRTLSPAMDFESTSSANSNTPASLRRMLLYYIS